MSVCSVSPLFGGKAMQLLNYLGGGIGFTGTSNDCVSGYYCNVQNDCKTNLKFEFHMAELTHS
jgi:hypothetical protein